MAEKKRRRRRENVAVRKNAVHLTLYDVHGGPVPNSVLDDAERYLESLAREHNLVVARADT